MMVGGSRPCLTGRGVRVLAALLGVKLVYAVAVTLLIIFGESYDAPTAAAIAQGWFPADWPANARGRWERHFATWDAEHYLYLSARGYVQEAPSRAFYPLWPLLIRAAGELTGVSPVVAGLWLANLCSLGAWWLFHRLTARRWGEAVADKATALLVIFPGSLFYQFIYSEALFFLLVMILWWGLEHRRWSMAWAAAFLAPCTRAVGVFGLIPLAWQWLVTRPWRWLSRWGWVREEQARLGIPAQREHRWLWGLLAAPVLGWTAYLGWMWAWAGHPLAGIEAQRYWGVHAIRNLWDLPRFLEGLVAVTEWHAFQGSLLDRLGFVLLWYTLPVQWRMGKDLLGWTLMLGVVPALSGTFVSYIRFESCAFPMFVALGGFFGRLKARWPFWLFAALSLAVHAQLLHRFLNYRWAG